MKKIIKILTIIIVLQIFSVKTFATEMSWPKCPSIKVGGAIVVDLSTGTPLIKKNANKKWYPASTTKIMTALLAIENAKSLDERVLFTKEALDAYERGSSSIGMRVGEELSLRDCLYGLMLASANEVANAIAIHVSGSMEEFVKLMNKRAKELGCTNTNFKNPSGLFEKDHYTTPSDLSKIARAAIGLEEFKKIAGTRTYVIPETNLVDEKRPLSNTNQLFNPVRAPQYGYEYAYAGKTGYTDEARFNLVSFAKKGSMDVVSVVMNAESRDVQYNNTIKLLEYVFKRFRMLQTDKIALNLDKNETIEKLLENDHLAEFTISGTAVLAVPKKCDVSGVKTEVSIIDIDEISEGKNEIGRVTYKYGENKIGETALIYNSSKSYRLSTVSEEIHIDNTSENIQGKKVNYKAIILIGTGVTIIIGVLWYIFIYSNPIQVRKRRYRRNKRNINRKNRLRW